MTPGSTPTPGDRPGPGRRAWEHPALGSALQPAVRSAVAAGVAGLLVAGLLALLVDDGDRAYTSRATLLLDQPRAVAGAPDDQLVIKLSRLRVKYRDLAAADAVVAPVAERVGMEPADVRRSTFVGLPEFALTVVAGARAADRVSAEGLAQALAERLAAYAAEEQEATGVPPEQRVELRLIADAGEAEELRPSRSRARTVASLGGVLAAVLAWAGLQLAAAARSAPLPRRGRD